MKYINFKRYKFSTAVKALNAFIYDFTKILKITGFKKIYKLIEIKKLNFSKITKYFEIKNYNINFLKKIDFFSSNFFIIHLPIAILFFGFLYLAIPVFYKYEKSNIENIICKKNNIQCKIQGNIKYRFFPTPRLKIKNLIINETKEKKRIFLTVDHALIKLSFKNLLAKEKHRFVKIELNQYESNIDLKNFKKYNNILNQKIDLIPVRFKNGRIQFFEGEEYIASITKANIEINFEDNSVDAELKGKFLNDDIFIDLFRENIKKKIQTDLILKMSNLNFLTKANFYKSENKKDEINGNFLVKKDKNKITGIFNYKNNEITINKSNIRNAFIDGKIEGQIKLLPYFDFNLDLNLNSINFTKLYNYFLSLDEEKQKKLFKISEKINGKLNFSADKVYSKHNLVNSFESRLKFYNGNLKMEQFLVNLGKLGAADILGLISKDKKYTNLKFESNIFVDNEKKFKSKFGIYDIEKISPNLFVSGSIDLENARASFYEIFDDEKLSNENINFIESEFNDLMLDNGFSNLFNFQKFKVFLKSAIDEKS